MAVYCYLLNQKNTYGSSFVADEQEGPPAIVITGFQYESLGETRRAVSMSSFIKDHRGVMHYNDFRMSPDEARAIAARLLDAADDADERLGYTLTPKGEAALV